MKETHIIYYAKGKKYCKKCKSDVIREERYKDKNNFEHIKTECLNCGNKEENNEK
jgi:RNase P subunit RPR2